MERPNYIKRFELLMYGSVVLGIVNVISNASAIQTDGIAAAGRSIGVAVAIAVASVYCLLIFQAARRKQNWARVVLLLWLLVSAPSAALNIWFYSTVCALTGSAHGCSAPIPALLLFVLPAAKQLLVAAGLYQVFITGSEWFRREVPQGNSASRYS